MGAAYRRSYKCWGYASKQKAALTSVTVETVRVLGVLGILLLAVFVTLKALFIFSVRVEDAADSARFRCPSAQTFADCDASPSTRDLAQSGRLTPLVKDSRNVVAGR